MWDWCVWPVVLSAWKVTKAVRFRLPPGAAFPYVALEFKKSYTESQTQEFDSVAIKWMSIILAPCVRTPVDLSLSLICLSRASSSRLPSGMKRKRMKKQRGGGGQNIRWEGEGGEEERAEGGGENKQT